MLSTPLTAASAAKPRIGFVLASMAADRFETDRAAFTAAVEAQGGTVLFASAGGDAEFEAERVNGMLASGALDALVLQPVDPLRAVALVEKAASLHVPVIAYDRFIPAPSLALYVTHDHRQLGVLQAQALRAARPQGGRVVLCLGQDGGRVASDIEAGNREALKGGNFQVVARHYHAAWSAEECEVTVLRALYAGPVDAVLANNSRMALGALEAIAAFDGASKIFVAGGDVTAESCRALRARRLAFDAFKPIAALAKAAAASALKLAAKPFRPAAGVVPTVFVPVTALTSANLAATLLADGSDEARAIAKRCEP